jgi:uncharacterized lipoprotein YehR (DUF1307 family)
MEPEDAAKLVDSLESYYKELDGFEGEQMNWKERYSGGGQP